MIDSELPISAAQEAFDDDFSLLEDEHRQRLTAILDSLVTEARPGRRRAGLAAAA